MFYLIIRKTALISCVIAFTTSAAQTEFPKEFIMHIKLGTGVIAVAEAPEYFVGNLQIIPQFTIIPHKLRGGIITGGFYTAKKVHGLFGPTISYKLTEFTGGYFGSLGNLHINIDHLWGTARQRLMGGGFNADVANRLVIGLSAHRDYNLANWWFGSSIALRISALKKEKESFPN